MIEFSRDKKTSVLICGGKKGEGSSAQLSPAQLLSLVKAASLPYIGDRDIYSVERKHFNGGEGWRGEGLRLSLC